MSLHEAAVSFNYDYLKGKLPWDPSFYPTINTVDKGKEGKTLDEERSPLDTLSSPRFIVELGLTYFIITSTLRNSKEAPDLH